MRDVDPGIAVVRSSFELRTEVRLIAVHRREVEKCVGEWHALGARLSLVEPRRTRGAYVAANQTRKNPLGPSIARYVRRRQTKAPISGELIPLCRGDGPEAMPLCRHNR